MTANVRGSKSNKKFVGVEPAWWDSENQFTKPEGWAGPTPVTDIMKEAGLIVEYNTVPIYMKKSDIEARIPGIVLPDQELFLINDKNALLRALDDVDAESGNLVPNVMNIVSDAFVHIPVAEMGRILDPLGQQMPPVTAGVLGNGSKFWVCLQGDDFSFHDDGYNEFIFINEDVSGGALRIDRTPVRVVCQNTWIMAQESTRSTITIPHTGDPTARLRYIAEVEGIIRTQRAETLAQFDALLNTKITPEILADTVEAAFPMPPKPELMQDYEETMARIDERVAEGNAIIMGQHNKALKAAEAYEALVRRCMANRVTVAGLYNQYNDEHPWMAGTGYALVNAVIERADFGGVQRAGHAQSVLTGKRAKVKEAAIGTVLKANGYLRATN